MHRRGLHRRTAAYLALGVVAAGISGCADDGGPGGADGGTSSGQPTSTTMAGTMTATATAATTTTTTGTTTDPTGTGGCIVGAQDCPCTPGGGCDEGLRCEAGSCVVEGICGNGMVEGAEACDDGNPVAADGCELDCTVSAGASMVDLGGAHTCVRRHHSSVRCWGTGADGRLGHADTQNIGDDEPAFVPGDVDVGAPVLAVAAGGSHTCVLDTVGQVQCFGRGDDGALGYGDTQDIGDDEPPAAAAAVDLGSSALAIATGDAHSCAVLTGGDVRCWGLATSGRLGYGDLETIGDDELPASVGPVDVGGPVIAIATGAAHTCALLDGGAVRCWGEGGMGRLGYGNIVDIGDDETPASAGAVDVGGTVVQLSAGAAHTCAVLNTGMVRCWGDAGLGRLGYGNLDDIGDDELPATAGDVPLGASAIMVAAGLTHTCALTDQGAVFCWGQASNGRLGYGNSTTIGDDETPQSVGPVDVMGIATTIDVGTVHTCATLTDSQVRCWGAGTAGRLGYGNTQSIGDDEPAWFGGDVPFELASR